MSNSYSQQQQQTICKKHGIYCCVQCQQYLCGGVKRRASVFLADNLECEENEWNEEASAVDKDKEEEEGEEDGTPDFGDVAAKICWRAKMIYLNSVDKKEKQFAHVLWKTFPKLKRKKFEALDALESLQETEQSREYVKSSIERMMEEEKQHVKQLLAKWSQHYGTNNHENKSEG
jgi:hypothetical protein